jgi:hypothetical protein
MMVVKPEHVGALLMYVNFNLSFNILLEHSNCAFNWANKRFNSIKVHGTTVKKKLSYIHFAHVIWTCLHLSFSNRIFVSHHVFKHVLAPCSLYMHIARHVDYLKWRRVSLPKMGYVPGLKWTILCVVRVCFHNSMQMNRRLTLNEKVLGNGNGAAHYQNTGIKHLCVLQCYRSSCIRSLELTNYHSQHIMWCLWVPRW